MSGGREVSAVLEAFVVRLSTVYLVGQRSKCFDVIFPSCTIQLNIIHLGALDALL